MEISEIYRIKLNKDNKTGYYISLTKRNIEERFNEH